MVPQPNHHNQSALLGSSIKSSSLLLSASYQSEASFTTESQASSSYPTQKYSLAALGDSLASLSPEDEAEQKKLVDEITEDVEDGCPVVKVPRRMYNGLSGVHLLIPIVNLFLNLCG